MSLGLMANRLGIYDGPGDNPAVAGVASGAIFGAGAGKGPDGLAKGPVGLVGALTTIATIKSLKFIFELHSCYRRTLEKVSYFL